MAKSNRSVCRWSGRAFVVVLLPSGGLACSAPELPAPPTWEITALSITAPTALAGSAEASAQRCASGQACADVAPGSRLQGDYELRAAPFARAAFDLGAFVTLTMLGDASVAFQGGMTPGLRFGHGLFSLEASSLGGPSARDPADARSYRLSLLEYALEIDPALPASITIRSLNEASATLLVRRGRIILRRGADTLEIRSGEAMTFAPQSAPRKQIGAAVAAALGDTLLVAPSDEQPSALDRPRGLGTMTARVPQSAEVVSGVRLASHKVHVEIRDGFARTEVEEVFANDTDRVLEGRYVFPVPPDASVSRLALWVGNDLVEGEMVERERAARIFKGIVEDSVRPRDPALLEWVSGSEVSLKIFPLPAHGSRKVVLAYDQVIDEARGHARYLYPLSLGADRAVKIDDFSMDLTASTAASQLIQPSTPGYAATIASEADALRVSFNQKEFTPASDFTFAYESVPAAATQPRSITAYRAANAGGFVAMRLPVRWPEGAPLPAHARRDRALLLDVSQSQSRETLAGEIAVAEGLLLHLEPDERFVLLACDSACSTYPEDGLAPATAAALAAARSWLEQRTLGGSSDIAGALQQAVRRLEPNGAGQIAYFGDGAATAGELSVETIAQKVSPDLEAQKVEIRLFGAGRTVDEVMLGGLARALGASYERVSTGEPLPRRVAEIALGLRSPLLTGARLEVPAGVHDVYPKALPSLRVGQELLVLARARPGELGEIKLRGALGGAPYAASEAIQWDSEAAAPNALVPRLWAAARITDLEGSNQPEAIQEVVALSRANYVMSRRTALLVLENDAMFAAFGIERTKGHGAGPSSPTPSFGRDLGPLKEASNFGMLGLLDNGHGASRFDEPRADGTLWGRATEDAFGSGGLGLGGVGTLGHGAGIGGSPGDGFGGPAGSAGSRRTTASPAIRMGASTVSGRIPPEVIQRIVRQNFGRFRLCYDHGLRNNPNLGGRVAVRFIIGRDGAVLTASDGGSDLSDAAVVACVVRSFVGLTFPEPEGGIVTVTYPIMFSNSGGADSHRSLPSPNRISRSPWDGRSDSGGGSLFAGPSASHRPGDDAWMTEGEDALNKLRQALRDGVESRQRHEALIRGLLGRGRFAEALTAARRFADLDPDLPRARELLAQAAAAQGDADLARTTLDAEIEGAPRSFDLHARVARACEAAGDERRACAHFRSLLELRPGSDDAQYEALRCQARLGDRDRALQAALSIKSPGKRITELIAALIAGPAPAYDVGKGSPGEFEARLTCLDGARSCPVVFVITPRGDIISPWTPAAARSDAHAVAFSGVPEGTYRTLLIGGAPGARGELTLRAHKSVRKFPVTRGGLQTVAITTVVPSPFSGFGTW